MKKIPTDSILSSRAQILNRLSLAIMAIQQARIEKIKNVQSTRMQINLDIVVASNYIDLHFSRLYKLCDCNDCHNRDYFLARIGLGRV